MTFARIAPRAKPRNSPAARPMIPPRIPRRIALTRGFFGAVSIEKINVNWTAPIFEEDRCVRAFARLRQRAPNNSNGQVTWLLKRRLFLFPWDQRLELQGWIHQMRR